jgi:hypothetical protein
MHRIRTSRKSSVRRQLDVVAGTLQQSNEQRVNGIVIEI